MKSGNKTEKIIVGAGATVHIQGHPFRLTQPAEMESHPANVDAVFVRTDRYRLKPTILDRLLRWVALVVGQSPTSTTRRGE